MMFGGAHHFESGLIGKDCHFAHFVNHLLELFVVSANRPKLFAFFERLCRDGWEGKQHEFHTTPPEVRQPHQIIQSVDPSPLCTFIPWFLSIE